MQREGPPGGGVAEIVPGQSGMRKMFANPAGPTTVQEDTGFQPTFSIVIFVIPSSNAIIFYEIVKKILQFAQL